MRTFFHRKMLVLAAASMMALGTASHASAHASAHASQRGATAQLELSQLALPKIKLGKLLPKVKFKPRVSLSRTGARVSLDAELTFGKLKKRISIFSLGIKKKGKSVRVRRKIGKLQVSLKVSWSGSRQIVIKGTARYMKLKVPFPKLRVKF